MNGKHFKIEQLRTPWVPAPGKSSGANETVLFDKNLKIQRKEYKTILSTSSSSEVNPKVSVKKQKMASQNPSYSTRKTRQGTYQRHVRRPLSQVKRAKNSRKRNGMQYTLQSKDSLVDVTACLQEKREEVMKLWEKSVLKGDPDLLSNIVTANRLALEAAEEVEKLRRTIQDFQNKEDGLSDSDCAQLEEMRVQVLAKVKTFEEADNLLQEYISRQSASKILIASSASKMSQTQTLSNNVLIPEISESTKLPPHIPLPLPHTHGSDHEAISTRDVIILKEKPSNFSEVSAYENETFMERQGEAIKMGSHESVFDNSLGAPTLTLENMNRLRLLYEEGFRFPPQPPMNLDNSATGDFQAYIPPINIDLQEVSVEEPQKQHSNHVRFSLSENKSQPQGYEKNEGYSRNTITEHLYREKISSLQRHLMNTENEVEELKSEIERIESDANFRVRLLQNTVQEKFDSLQVIPDYLKLVDQKLNETVQDKKRIQNELESKDALIKEIKEENKNLRMENSELRDQLRKAENCKDFFTFKNTELEKSNAELRKQVDELTKKLAKITCHIESCKYDDPISGNVKVPADMRQDMIWENHRLKMQCAELKEQISQSKRIVHFLRKSKTKLVSSLNARIDELMDALQNAQHHKRILGDQIVYLKKSYNELFPADMFKTCPSRKPSRISSKKSATKMRQTTSEVEEPKLQATSTWQTGHGIKLDDLLQVKLP